MNTDPAASDSPFDRFRDYLCLMARLHMGKQLQAKLDASDVAQQTLLEAHLHRDQFRGRTEAEIMAWLRQILAHNLSDALRGLARGKRDVSRERSLQEAMDRSSARLEDWIAADQSTPSMRAERHEQLLRLAATMGRLPEDRRAILLMRYCQGMSVAEISEATGRTLKSVAGLLQRGLIQVREFMQESSDDTDPSAGPGQEA